VRGWVKQAEIDAGTRDGLTSEEKEKLSRLCLENRRLREDVEILRRAVVGSPLCNDPPSGVVVCATDRSVARWVGSVYSLPSLWVVASR
jgi:hypothetical protein